MNLKGDLIFHFAETNENEFWSVKYISDDE